jgi:hypothetical protein
MLNAIKSQRDNNTHEGGLGPAQTEEEEVRKFLALWILGPNLNPNFHHPCVCFSSSMCVFFIHSRFKP